MADIKVHPSSVETVHIPIRNVHPVTGDSDLSTLTVEVALPADGAAPSDWVTTAWETGTRRIDNDRYYLAKITLGAGSFILVNGTTYQSWARVTTSGANKFYVTGGRVVADNT